MKELLLKKTVFITFLVNSLFAHSQTQYFGDKCIGNWQGTMHLYNNGVLRDSVVVKLNVEKASPTTWSWKTEYISTKQPVTKNYVLRLIDSSQNKYVTDEGDGLELTDYVFGNKLYSVFETNDILLTSSYELVDDSLIFEVTSGRKEPQKHQEINTFSINNLQRVIFKRVN